MRRLVDREFWDERHEHHVKEEAQRQSVRTGFFRRFFDNARLRVGAQPLEAYSGYLVAKAFQLHLPSREDWSCLEVGCAPGRNLITLHRMFKYQPCGVEYSPVGAQETRETLTRAKLDPTNIIESDFFDDQFQREHAGRYNVVVSRGFIEHFDNPAEVVRKHVNLLAPGGFLLCTIPNLRGWTYPFLGLFGRDLLRAHNCTIMRRHAYESLFVGQDLEPRFCDYVGVFQPFGVALRKERSLRGIIAKVVDRAGGLLDHMMFVVLRGRALETRWSPHLVYIGRRTT